MTSTAAGTENMTAWLRWAVGIVLLIIINFASVAYYSGARNAEIDSNTKRIDRIEKLIEITATKDQVQEIREDLKDVRLDIKNLLRESR